jgi:hypothetical protein
MTNDEAGGPVYSRVGRPDGQTKLICNGLNLIGVALTLIMTIVTARLGSTMELGLVYGIPWLCLLLVVASRGRISILLPGGGTGSLAAAFFVPILGIAMLIPTDLHLLGSRGLLPTAVGLTLMTTVIAFIFDPAVRERLALLPIVAFGGLLWSWQAAGWVDCLLDPAEPRQMNVRVVEKIPRMGLISQAFGLAPWGPQTEPTTAFVSAVVYGAVRQDEPACIQYGQGALGVPWYKIEACS